MVCDLIFCPDYSVFPLHAPFLSSLSKTLLPQFSTSLVVHAYSQLFSGVTTPFITSASSMCLPFKFSLPVNGSNAAYQRAPSPRSKLLLSLSLSSESFSKLTCSLLPLAASPFIIPSCNPAAALAHQSSLLLNSSSLTIFFPPLPRL